MALQCEEERILIDTYPEPAREEFPMFAENRVHQRTSGNPYPNKVVIEEQRTVREKREYTLIRLKNEFLEIGILPALGGKIWYVTDLVGKQPLFYQNHVVKPAPVGALGSWTSGGVEFNWPTHHRFSAFMPVDYAVERGEGEITVWLSEHDPIDRMKGMVGVRLREGECRFSTLVKLDNVTPLRKSFLWWENAAVAVGENYRIFFPQDVNYVRFHYKRSVMTYPIASSVRGLYNGLSYADGTDLRLHKNTVPATSYFSAASKYGFFGGYDDAKAHGVVHAADRGISPGKKLFTWGYGKLAEIWERALTDSDGAYAELMAGCYSDNQPDFSFLEPYECKTFAQHWYPIHGKGTPVFADEHGALFATEDGLYYMSVRSGRFRVRVGEEEGERTLSAYENTRISDAVPPSGEFVLSRGADVLSAYAFGRECGGEIPSPRRELPSYTALATAEECYLEGLHIAQYRSPEYRAETLYREALKRDPGHTPSLIALAEWELAAGHFGESLSHADAAEKRLGMFNARFESGKVHYLKGLALLGLMREEEAYAAFERALWSRDYAVAARLHLGLSDLKRGFLTRAAERFSDPHVISDALRGWCLYRTEGTTAGLELALARDPLNLFALVLRCIACGDYAPLLALKTDLTQDVLDVASVLLEGGMREETATLLRALLPHLCDSARYLLFLLTGEKAGSAGVGNVFPFRPLEEEALRAALAANPDDGEAAYLLGCLLYGRGDYAEGAQQFTLAAREGRIDAMRCLAVAQYSHLNMAEEAERTLSRAIAADPENKQLIFEHVYVMLRLGKSPRTVIRYLGEHGHDRDDLTVELARAYNLNGNYERALEVLLSREFVACEGGEHYIADQYAYACYLKGKKLYGEGNYGAAAQAFEDSEHFPDRLGAGYWNEVKTVPFRYFKGRCLEKMGKMEEAHAIYRAICAYPFDYFTEMYLPTLGYYKVRSLFLLGDESWREVAEERKKVALESSCRKESGFFGTTPFFLSYIGDPVTSRKRFYAYPLYLYARALGGDGAEWLRIMKKDGYELYIDDFTI